jgi:transcriptional regulator GlxA family with amidase domain
MSTHRIGALVFPGFELLDLFGPLEMFGMYPETFPIRLVAESHEPVPSNQGPVSLPDDRFADDGHYDLLLVPGGAGTRREVDNPEMIAWLRARGDDTPVITSVCTGSALLARAGLLDGRSATTNKNAFGWVSGFGNETRWVRQARWVHDGRFYTASGVSAGTDMSLAVIADLLGESAAQQATDWGEYFWNRDPRNDPFAIKAGLVEDG